MTEEFKLQMSELCQPIEQGGHSINVEIYGDGKGQWILEVTDTANNSTVWEDSFKTEQAALDEVLDTIKQEGIECLIGQTY